MNATDGFWSPDGQVNLIITVVLFTWSAAMVWRGALLGARGHARPRLFVAVALTMGAAINGLALFDAIQPDVRLAMARAVTWVLAVSLGFTALTGVKYGRKVQSAVEVFEKLAADDEQDT